MDTKSNKKAGGATKNSKSKARGTNTSSEAKEGRKVKKPYNCPTGTARGNPKKAPPQKVDQKKILKPVKEQIEIALEYINILEFKKNFDIHIDIKLLVELINYIKKQCEIYLNYHSLLKK